MAPARTLTWQVLKSFCPFIAIANHCDVVVIVIAFFSYKRRNCSQLAAFDLFVGGNTMLSIIVVMFDALHSMRLVLCCWILLTLAYLTSSSAMQIGIIMKCSTMTQKACLLCSTMARGIEQFLMLFVSLHLGSDSYVHWARMVGFVELFFWNGYIGIHCDRRGLGVRKNKGTSP